jgi:hypothetical protein
MVSVILGLKLFLFAGIAHGGMPGLPAVSSASNGRQVDAAVVVGIEEYPQISSVPFAKADSKAFYNWLRTSGVADPANIYLLQDWEAERVDILEALKDAKKNIAPGGRIWFYFAGHGIAHPNTGKRLFVMGNGGPDSYVERSVSFEEIKETVAGTALTVVADACFNGKGRDGADIRGGKRFMTAVEDIPTAPTDNVEAWFSVTANESSSPLEGAQHGAFTYFLVGGLSGWADKNGDQNVDTAELHNFVKTSLRTIQIRDQTPTFNGSSRSVVKGLSVAAPLFDPMAAKQRASKSRPNSMSGAIQSLKNQLSSTAPGSREHLYIQAKLLKKQASHEWVELVALAADAGPKAVDAIAKFIQTYDGNTVGEGNDRMPVRIAEIEEAKRKLAALRNAAPTGPDDGADPRTRARAMVKDKAWASNLRLQNPGVLFPGSGFDDFGLGVLDDLTSISSPSCTASGVKLKPRDCSQVKGNKIDLVNSVQVQQRHSGKNLSVTIGMTSRNIQMVTLKGFGATPEGATIGEATAKEMVAMYGEPTGAKESRIGVKLIWADLGLEAQFKTDGTLFSLIAKPPR